MNSSEDHVFCYDKDGKEYCNEEEALSILLKDEVLFSNGRDYHWEGAKEGNTVVLFVNCNDIFAWACADAEDLPHNQIGNLYKMHIADKKWGASKWCCIQRKQKPQKPVEEAMKKDGSWDDLMENLSSNTQDDEVKSYMIEAAYKLKERK